MTFLGKLWASLKDSMTEKPVTPELLRKTYAELSDAQLNNINEKDLTPMAVEALKAEKAARNIQS
jgi:hypothetical protein